MVRGVSLARGSRLLRPDALWVRTEHSRQMPERVDDINRVVGLCKDFRQVCLVGAAGVGKSLFLRAGLGPLLRSLSPLFPLYLDIWGQDWQTVPRLVLAEALWEALSVAERHALALSDVPAPEACIELLAQCHAKLGRTPLLIFDQFDVYQTQHHQAFFSTLRHAWLSAEQVLAANAFWGDIRSLMEAGAVHCLFVIRNDLADGLESIRFVPPQVYRLDRLPAAAVSALLGGLTTVDDGAGPIIEAPEQGWEALKDRLVHDLTWHGTVLPGQLHLALHGLASLRTLNIRAYEQCGGLPGLEAAGIQRHVVAAVAASGLTHAQVETLLVACAHDASYQCLPRTLDDLVASLEPASSPPHTTLPEAVECALLALATSGLLRRRMTPAVEQPVWSLAHGYLGRRLMELRPLARRGPSPERFAAFHKAVPMLRQVGHAWRRPLPQVGTAMQSLGRRVRYGLRPVYLAGSSLLLVGIGLAGMLVFQRNEVAPSAHAKVTRMRMAIGLQDFPSPTETAQLWELATSQATLRQHFLQEVLALPANAEQFNRRAAMIVQAAVGLDPEQRKQILRQVVLPCGRTPLSHQSVAMACAQMGMQLAAESEYPEFRDFLLKSLTTAGLSSSVPYQAEILAEGWRAMAEQLSSGQARQAFEQLLAIIEAGTENRLHGMVLDAMSAVASRLAPAEAQPVVDQMIRAVEESAAPERLRTLTAALHTVPGALALAHSERILQKYAALITTTADPEQLRMLAEGMRLVWGEFPSLLGFSVFEQLWQGLQNAVATKEREALIDVLQTVAGKLPAEEAREVFARLTAATRSTLDPWLLRALTAVLHAVPGSLTSGQARQVFTQLTSRIEATTDPLELDTLVQALLAVPGELDPDDAWKAMRQLIKVLETTTHPGQQQALVEDLAGFPRTLLPVDAWMAMTRLTSTVGEGSDAGRTHTLAAALRAIPEGALSAAQVSQIFEQIIRVIEGTSDPGHLWALATALRVIPDAVSTTQAEQVNARLLRLIETTTDPENLWALLAAIRAVPGTTLTVQQTARVFSQLTRLIAVTTDRWQLDLLIEALKMLPGDVDIPQLIEVLKWPVSVGALRSALLEILARQTGEKFEGKPWKMVTWAQAQHFDVTRPPAPPPR